MPILCQDSTNSHFDGSEYIIKTHLYLITNIINNKKYIGVTTQNPPNNRWIGHKTVARRRVRTTPLYNSINKYGENNFKFEILFSSKDSDYVFSLENFFIDYYETKNRNKGYNLADGGEVPRGFKIPKHIAKQGALKRSGENHYLYGKKMKKETREKLSKSRMGSKVSEETKLKISESHKKNPRLKGITGENHPAYGKKKPRDSVESGRMKHPLRKELKMIDKDNGETLMIFKSKSEGARWLIDNDKCKSKNVNSLISSIGLAVKRDKPYYGYKWELVE